MHTQKSNDTMVYHNPDEIQSFLKSVVEDEQEREEVLSGNPDEFSKKTFNYITGLQFAFLAIYWHIGEMLIRFIGIN
jgi:hypothetical protein